MVFVLLCLLFISTGVGTAVGQKKPTALKLDVDSDDKQLCNTNSSIKDSQFCDYYKAYTKSDATPEQKMQARNDMIELVRGQIDTYYKMRKDGRKTKIRWLQTLLDFLEIGTATAITIMNGERAKTVVGAALNGFQGGRTSFNRNFEILQTQVLINKMNANRAEIFTEIARSKSLKASDYSWYAAKNDLRNYLFAGTFNNALDTLVNETGAEVVEAEEELRIVESQLIVGATTSQNLTAAEGSRNALRTLDADLKSADATTKDNALATLRAIVVELNTVDQLKQLLEGKGVSATSDGASIIKALILLRRELTIVGKDDLVKQINDIIIKKSNM